MLGAPIIVPLISVSALITTATAISSVNTAWRTDRECATGNQQDWWEKQSKERWTRMAVRYSKEGWRFKQVIKPASFHHNCNVNNYHFFWWVRRNPYETVLRISADKTPLAIYTRWPFLCFSPSLLPSFASFNFLPISHPPSKSMAFLFILMINQYCMCNWWLNTPSSLTEPSCPSCPLFFVPQLTKRWLSTWGSRSLHQCPSISYKSLALS